MTITRADHFEIHFCGSCPNAHLIFYDSDNRPFAEATITADQADLIAKHIHSRSPARIPCHRFHRLNAPPTAIFGGSND